MQTIRISSGGVGLGLYQALFRAPELRADPWQSLSSCLNIGGEVVCPR